VIFATNYDFVVAFAVSSLLTLVAVLTLIAKRIVERHVASEATETASREEDLAA
jgi:ABC-type sulfate transport system permease subunit